MELLLGSEVTVSSQLDVTSQQHLFLLGQNGAHFLSVMHQTQTQIMVPDLSAPQSPPSLLIQGSPDGVCLARQQLMVHSSVLVLSVFWDSLKRKQMFLFNIFFILVLIFSPLFDLFFSICASRTVCQCV